jgi:hypothetical protein
MSYRSEITGALNIGSLMIGDLSRIEPTSFSAMYPLTPEGSRVTTKIERQLNLIANSVAGRWMNVTRTRDYNMKPPVWKLIGSYGSEYNEI